MDLSVRDWLIIIGGLLAVAVLLDGYRRMRNDRRESIRLSSRKRRDDTDDELINPELPGGGVRVAPRDTASLHVRQAKPAPRKPTGNAGVDTRREPSFEDDDILFRDPDEEYGAAAGSTQPEPEDLPEPEKPPARSSEPELAPVRSRRDFALDPGPEDTQHGDAKDDIVAGLSARDEDRPKAPPARAEKTSRRGTQAKNSTATARDDQYHELLVIHVLAPKGKPFNGADMLQILLACDVRYGKMNIFHRYEKSDGTGAIQFSIANIVEPGDFELDGIEEFTTPGLVFFMHLPGPENSIKAFDAMEETARCLVKNLGGELRDQTHSVATKQTLEHYRQRIRDFERRQLTLM